MKNNAIRNLYCVGRNYREHATELGNAVPDAPMLFMKPVHALTYMDGGEIAVPGDRGDVHYEAELVIHIGRPYEGGIQVDELVDRYALGLDLTLRDIQSELKKKGQPWLAAKGFLGSAPIGPFRPFPGIAKLETQRFTLSKNGYEVQKGCVADMIFSLQTIVDFCAEHYGLAEGDLIYTGTPAGVGPVADGDRFALLMEEEAAGECVIRLRGASGRQ